MNRLLSLFIALALGIWAQRTLTGPQPGIPRDALILFIIASIIFVWNAQPPKPLRSFDGPRPRPWPRRGLLISLAGLLLALIALVLLWLDLGSLPGLLLWPVSTVLFVAGAWNAEFRMRNAESGESESEAQETEASARKSGLRITPHALRRWLSAHWDIVILVLILLAAIFVRFHQLDVYPNGCQSDECNNGLDALKWLNGAPYTPYAETNEGQATLFTYLIALSFKLFGVGVTQMRIVSAFVGVLTVLAFYFLARDLYGRKAGLAATALLATSRWHITFSRIVYELIMQPLFMILMFYFMLRGVKSGRRRDWALAGLSLAVGLNTYTAFRIVPFIVAAFLIFWLLRVFVLERERFWPEFERSAIMAGGSFVAILPLGVYVIQNWKVFISRISHISVMNDVERLGTNQPIWDNLRKTLTMFNWKGDGAALNNLPGAPMLDTIVGVLFVLGLAYALWYALQARPLPVLTLLWFVAIISLGVLSVAHEAPTARRTIGLIPLIYLLAGLVIRQFFITWERTWQGLGNRTFYGLAAAAILLLSISNARLYLVTQAQHPDVWNAYSPGESAVGEYLTTLSPDATVLITPQFEHHSAIRLMAREHPYRALNPVDDLPYQNQTNGDLVYVLEPVDKPLFGLLSDIYPRGAGQEHQDRFGRPLFLSYTVPQADLAATQGLVGQYFSSYPPAQAPEASQPVRALDLDMAQSPLPAPFFALWEGTLLVPEYGQYTFELQAEGEAAALQIGREQRLDLTAPGQDSLTVTLAAGFHPIRVEFRSGQQPGQLSLSWSGPGFGPRLLDSSNLYTFNLGGQGLVGYYYPNGDWQGQPALVRNDLLIVPNNPLREPFSILWRGKIAIPRDGTYTFGTRSDDGSYLFIDGQLVVDNSGSHGAEDRQGRIQLSQGFHDIEVRYNELGGSREMQLWWTPPGQGRAVVDNAYLFPLEGDALPEGLTLPPPPEIELPGRGPEIGAGEIAAGEAEAPARQPSGAAPPVQQPGDFPVLDAALLWTFGSCGAGDEQLSSPRGLAVDPVSGAVYIADAGNFRIVKLDDDGEFDASWGEQGDGPDQFQEPFDLVVEPDGNLLVLDAVSQRLLRFSPGGDFIDTFGAALTFYRPRGLGADAAGQLVVADTGGVRIVRLTAAGQVLEELGGRESDLASKQPTDAVLTPGGDITFVEAESGVITRVEARGGMSRWQGPRPASTIDAPHLAVRPAGGLYATDPEGQRVLLFDAAGAPLGQFGQPAGLLKPTGIAAALSADGTDLVLVTDSAACRVLAFGVGM